MIMIMIIVIRTIMKNSNYLEQREKDTKGLTKIKQSYFETNDYDPTPNPTPPHHANQF